MNINPSAGLFEEAGWPTLDQLVTSIMITHVGSTLAGRTPSYFDDCFLRPEHDHLTRSVTHGNLFVPSVALKADSRKISNRCIHAWNSLPNSMTSDIMRDPPNSDYKLYVLRKRIESMTLLT